MRVYPDAHPRSRKARVDIDGAIKAQPTTGPWASAPPSPRIQSVQLPPPALDVVLQPGDALFVPAFWFHHVEVVDSPRGQGAVGYFKHLAGDKVSAEEEGLSVSLNVFSHSLLTSAAGEILSRPPPILPGEDMEGRTAAYAHLAARLSDELGLGSDFPHELFRARYAALNASSSDNDSFDDERKSAHEDGSDIEKSFNSGGVGTAKAKASCFDLSRVDTWAVTIARDLQGNLAKCVYRDEDSPNSQEITVNTREIEPQDKCSANPSQAVAHLEGVTSVVAAHLLELVALRSFGPLGISRALEAAALFAEKRTKAGAEKLKGSQVGQGAQFAEGHKP